MNPTPDAMPLTGIPWLDALVKIAGAVGIIGSILANVLPKGWALTSVLTRTFLDGRKVQSDKGELTGAIKEAAAQQIGLSTLDVRLPPVPIPPNFGGPE